MGCRICIAYKPCERVGELRQYNSIQILFKIILKLQSSSIPRGDFSLVRVMNRYN